MWLIYRQRCVHMTYFSDVSNMTHSIRFQSQIFWWNACCIWTFCFVLFWFDSVPYGMIVKLSCSSWVFQISMMTHSISIMQTWRRNQSQTTSRWVWASNNGQQWGSVSASSPALLTLLTWHTHTHTHTAPLHPLISGQLFLHPDFNSNDHVILIYINSHVNICHVMITLITFKQR